MPNSFCYRVGYNTLLMTIEKWQLPALYILHSHAPIDVVMRHASAFSYDSAAVGLMSGKNQHFGYLHMFRSLCGI